MSKITVFNKTNLNVSKLCDISRQYLGLHVTNNYTEATDGHIAVRVEALKQDPEDMPGCPGEFNQAPIEEDFNVIINKDNAAKLLKSLPKSSLPIIDRKTWVYSNDKEMIGFSMTDLESWNPLILRKEEATFPDIDAVLPKEDKQGFEITLDANILSKLANFYASNCKNSIKLIFHKDDSGDLNPDGIIMFQGVTEDEQRVSSLLMPMKSADHLDGKFFGRKEKELPDPKPEEKAV